MTAFHSPTISLSFFHSFFLSCSLVLSSPTCLQLSQPSPNSLQNALQTLHPPPFRTLSTTSVFDNVQRMRDLTKE